MRRAGPRRDPGPEGREAGMTWEVVRQERPMGERCRVAAGLAV
ncbi:hypothetical protein KCH_04430 [Kitasatospora cheerisanensis KCTC 2395]|uniref:Uncharacterized protein n=1 Tax=Kitasatospora cheerisanensis KCTC 2395 TaxID=1348663 RepID=A0A066ZBW0_9ACTN|nr:hypothetical protein KCH_04430 [Kitasatospora cheerisanensis KCTC 2395]